MELMHTLEVAVRFSEVDSMNIVWHGNYLKYFEDGRESFGTKFNLGYLDVHKHNVMIPIVKASCDFKKPLVYGDIAIVETKYIPCEAAKIVFQYRVLRKRDNEVMATGTTTQVFLTPAGDLLLTSPDFYTGWKKLWEVDKI